MAGDHPPLVVYLSSEAHTTLHKAVELLGLGTPVTPSDAGRCGLPDPQALDDHAAG